MLTQIMRSLDTSTSQESTVVDLEAIYTWAIQFTWTNTTNGVAKAQISNDEVNWIDVVGSDGADINGTPGSYIYNLGSVAGYKYIRAIYTRTSGTGIIDCYLSGKESTVNSSTLEGIIEIGEKYVRSTRFATISAGTSGVITLPLNAQVVLDDFGGTTDAVISTMFGGKPTFEHSQDAGYNFVGTSFNTFGNYVLSAVPSIYPVAIIYRVRQQIKDFDGNAPDILGGVDFDSGPGIVLTSNIDGGISNSAYGGTIPVDGGSSTSF